MNVLIHNGTIPWAFILKVQLLVPMWNELT